MRTPAQYLILLAFAVASPLFSQDLLQLPNGATLPGKLVEIENGIIHFEADYIGLISVSATEASVIEGATEETELAAEDETPLVDADDVPTGELVAAEPTKTEIYEESDGELVEIIEPESLWYEFWEWNLLSDKWSGDFTLGFTDISSNVKSREIRLNGKLTYQATDIDQFQWEGYYQYKEQDGKASVDKYGTSLRYRHDLSERFFIQNLNKYDIDRIKKIYTNLQNSVGIGWRALDTERLKLNFVPGVGSQYIDQAGPSGWFFKLNAYQDFQWIIWRDLTFDQRLDYWVQPNDTANYSYTFRAGLTTTLVGNFILRLSYQKDFDNNVVGGTTKDERTIAASLGFKF